jgi:hypothetical protein
MFAVLLSICSLMCAFIIYLLCRYDREEHTTMFDGESSMYFTNESSYQKKEAELTKKLVSLSLSLSLSPVFCLDFQN